MPNGATADDDEEEPPATACVTDEPVAEIHHVGAAEPAATIPSGDVQHSAGPQSRACRVTGRLANDNRRYA